MYNKLKDRAKITDQDPCFKARYIGSAATFTASGRGCTTPLVQKLWDNSEEEHFLPRVVLKITASGIQMKYLDKKKAPSQEFPIENISFCNVDLEVNDRIFSWIFRPSDDQMWTCHAVVCSGTEKARAMALVLTRAFHVAYKEWKAEQTKGVRELEKINRTQSLPAISLMKKSKTRTTVAKRQSLNTQTVETMDIPMKDFKSETLSTNNHDKFKPESDADIKPGTSRDYVTSDVTNADNEEPEICDLRL
ncbi:protein FAM43A-like [Mya arenaria]|uniref:protein FAM43A-like n=1 Tax=Mya arenaria TaxID=6604 RepID=UPI0022E267AD|nr:protein FAM43A-like [Mya arenaria]